MRTSAHVLAVVLLATLTAGCGAAGGLTSEPIEFLTHVETLPDSDADSVADLKLPQGTKDRLVDKLDQALAALEDEDDENDDDAIRQIEAFVHEVEALRGNGLTEVQAVSLVALADNIVRLLGSN